jgi:hypothetical protein
MSKRTKISTIKQYLAGDISLPFDKMVHIQVYEVDGSPGIYRDKAGDRGYSEAALDALSKDHRNLVIKFVGSGHKHAIGENSIVFK